MTDYLIDLIEALDRRYDGLRLALGGEVLPLGDLGTGGPEVLACAIDMAQGPARLHMHTRPNDIHAVILRLKENAAGAWDITLEAGTKSDELAIDELLGQLKETYP